VNVCTRRQTLGERLQTVGKPGRLKESLSTVSTVPIGGDRSKVRMGTQDNSAFHE
jgi:hypothetical protein